MTALLALGMILLFVLQCVAFWAGSKLAGVKNVKISSSVLAAFLTLIISKPIDWVVDLVPILFMLNILLWFIVPTLVVKEIYKVHIERAFWAAFGSIMLNVITEITIKIIGGENVSALLW